MIILSKIMMPVLAVILFCWIVLATFAEVTHELEWIRCHAVKVIDGNTVKLSFMFHKQQVKLAGLVDNSFDPRAASFLGNIILNKDCEFAETNGPEIGALRVIEPEPIDVNGAMLEEGMARWDPKTSYNKSLKKAETIARSAKRGIWK